MLASRSCGLDTRGIPVCPKPPLPRVVGESSATGRITDWKKGWKRSWAMRWQRRIVRSSFEVFSSETMISPR
jgi:hypothetical protein